MSTGRDMRVSATTYDLEDLVSEAWAGRIRVPHFQRNFRWALHDVLRLFDSIVKGYPIGSLLLWVRPAEAQAIRLGALEIHAPETEQALWVVDGQQRITSLANALHEKGGMDPRFALSYDLSAEVFVRRSTQPDPSLIPLSVLFDLDRLLQWFANHREVSDQLQKATSVAKTLHQFKVPAYQVKQDDVAVLQDIFDRMNNYGKRLSKAEVFSALYAGKETAKDELLSFALIAEHIDEDLHFGRIDDDTVLRAILARRGPDVEREIRIEFNEKERRGTVDFPRESLATAYESGEQALGRAVRFLQQTARVPHVTFLAYQYLLIVLSRLFAHHPEPDTRNLRLLRRWFWRAALAGPALFKGSTTGTTRALCSTSDQMTLPVRFRACLLRSVAMFFPCRIRPNSRPITPRRRSPCVSGGAWSHALCARVSPMSSRSCQRCSPTVPQRQPWSLPSSAVEPCRSSTGCGQRTVF